MMSVVDGSVDVPDTADCAGDWMSGSLVMVVVGVDGWGAGSMVGDGVGTPRAAANAFI